MACIVCKRDVSESALHRACILQLFKETKIKGIADWIRLSTKPKTILKRRVFLQLEHPTTPETPHGAGSQPHSQHPESPSVHLP